MLETVGGLLALLALGVFIVAAAILGHWLLGPVNRAAGHLNAPTRFMLPDFIWLMIQLQLMLGLALFLLRETPERGRLVILAALSIPVVVLWAASVSVVSRAGITDPLRRATVILVLVPGALAEIMSVPLLLVASFVAVTTGPGSWVGPILSDDFSSRMLGLAAAATVMAFWALAVRWLSFWVIAAPAASGTVGR